MTHTTGTMEIMVVAMMAVVGGLGMRVDMGGIEENRA